MRRTFTIAALTGAAIALASPANAGPALHGFCNSTPCADNGTNTPTTANPPEFGFTSGGQAKTGTLLIDILVPDNVTAPTSFSFTGWQSGTANLVTSGSSNTWTSGFLSNYLGLSASPANPIGAYLPTTQTYDSGATGFYVYQAVVGTVTLPTNSTADDSYLMQLGQNLAQGSYIVAFLGQTNRKGVTTYLATANSGAILETAPPLPEPATWAMMLLGFGAIGTAMRRKSRRSNALTQVA